MPFAEAGALAGVPQQQQPYPFTLDFETGDFRGWSATGNAFAFQPTLDDNPTARQRGQPSNHQGRYWIGTFERYQGRGQKPGTVQGDRPQGTLISPAFEIPSGSLNFLVGGGSSPATRVELVLWDEIENVRTPVFSASGADTETMRRVKWDLTEVAGNVGRLRIVDSLSTGWGHISVDDFRFSSRPGVPDTLLRLPPPIVGPMVAVVSVPDLSRQTVEGAAEILNGARLNLGPVTSEIAAEPLGTVIDQSPQPGATARPGSAVSVVVAAGVEVPRLLGRRIEEVAPLVARARLKVGEESSELSDRPIGTVIRQEPPAGMEVPLGWPVSVVVAAGVRVPPLEGGRIGEAEQELSGAGLGVGEVSREPSERPPGTVLGQTPAAGVEVPLRTPVDLVVAAPVPVPDLIGRDSAVAVGIVERARLRLGAVGARPSARPPGTVIEQRPPANEPVPLRTEITIVIAAPVPVPDVVGRDSAAARQLIARSQLQIVSTRDEPSELPTGTVIAQEPGAGTLVPLASPIALVLAAGVPVPNVVGRTIGDARSVIGAAGLEVAAVLPQRSSQPPGTVLRQTPEADRRVPLRTGIELVAAAGVAVPDLIGHDSTEARVLLSEAELRAGEIEAEPSHESPGIVLEQYPPAGDQVALQSLVDVVISAAVPVPDLIGRDRSEAERLLADIELQLGSADSKLSFRPSQTVLSQEPPPGSLVRLGTNVSVVIARHVPVGGVGAGLLTLLLASGLFVRTRVSRRRRPKREVAHEAAGLTATSHPDRGTQAIEGPALGERGLELRWRAIVDRGVQTIESAGPLLEEERDE